MTRSNLVNIIPVQKLYIAVSAQAQWKYGQNTGKCSPIAKISVPQRKSGSPDPKEVTKVLMHYGHCNETQND